VELIPDLQESLEWNDVHFVPVRHHSPACATALQRLLDEVQPAAVLVEGPREFDALLPLLADARTRCPVAIFSQASEDAPAWFFPLCDSSPERVALLHAHAKDVPAHFIDLSPSLRPRLKEEGSHSLMDESRLAHSTWVQTLVEKTGCRNHDELWERLFELRTFDQLGDWRGFFREVHAWCALGRASWSEDAIEADGDLAREECMAQEILRHRKLHQGPLVVVTGGFHTSGLLATLRSGRKVGKVPTPDTTTSPWLIRYGFRELDALTGYASGMPSPAWQQSLWEGFRNREQTPSLGACRTFLLQLGRTLRHGGVGEPVGTPAVEAAIVQAQRLAQLRGLVAPGRSELLDAAHSCFLKEARTDARTGFSHEVHQLLGGTAMGDIPPSSSSPPLVEDTRRQARAARVDLDDTSRRTVKLDLHRKPAHRERERFFQLAAFLEIPLAAWQTGPDLLNGIGMDRLFSQWQVAWTPMVESSLYELSSQGSTLQSLAARKISEELSGSEENRPQCSDGVRVLQKAAILGVLDRIPDWKGRLAQLEAQETSFPSLVDACKRLTVMRQVQGLTDFPEPAWLDVFLARTWQRTVFALDDLLDGGPESDGESQRQLTESVADALLTLREIAEGFAADSDLKSLIDPSLFQSRLQGLARSRHVPPLLSGAAVALLALSESGQEILEQATSIHLGTGAGSRAATDFLRGVLRTGPELLLREGGPLKRLHELVGTWDEDRFLDLLPELRQSFQALDPLRIEKLAGQIRTLAGGEIPFDPFAAVDVPEGQILSMARFEALLAATLDREGIGHWLAPLEAT
jgi:hypothetical protein